jgi:hypothetical protein
MRVAALRLQERGHALEHVGVRDLLGDAADAHGSVAKRVNGPRRRAAPRACAALLEGRQRGRLPRRPPRRWTKVTGRPSFTRGSMAGTLRSIPWQR